MHSLSGSALLQEALLNTTLYSTNSSSNSSNSSSGSGSEILSRIAPSLLRARVAYHLTVLALFAVASHSGRVPQRCAASLQRHQLQQGLSPLLSNAELDTSAAMTEVSAAAVLVRSSSNSSSYSDSASSVHYGDRLSAQCTSSAVVAPGLRVTVCDATVLAAVLESTARIYGTTSTTATTAALSDSNSYYVDISGVSDGVMAAAGQQAVLCAPVDCASGYATVQLLYDSNDSDAIAGNGTLTLPLRALYATPPQLLLRTSALTIGSSVRIAQRDWLQQVLQSMQNKTSSSTNNSDNSVLLSMAGETAEVVALGSSDWVGVQAAAGTEAAVPLAALRLASVVSTVAAAAVAAVAGARSSRRDSGTSASTGLSRKKLAAVTRRRRSSATSASTRHSDSPVQLTSSPLQHTKRKNSSSSSSSSSARHSAAQQCEQPPAYSMQSSAVEASISSSAESGLRLLPTYADRAAVNTAVNSEAVAAVEPFSLARVRGPPPPRKPSNASATTASASAAVATSTQRALYREPEPTQGRVLGHASDTHDDNYHTDDATAAARLWGTDGRVLRSGSAPAATAVVYDSPSPPQRPRSARMRSTSLSAAAAATATNSVQASLLHTEHTDQQSQQQQQRRRRPSTASAGSHCSSGTVSLHSATLYFDERPPPPFSERRASSSRSNSGAVCTGPACRTGIAAATSSANNSDSSKQQQQASAKPWRPPAGSSAALKQQDIATVRKLNAKVAARLARTVRTERARDEAVYDRLLASRVRRAQAVAADSAAAVATATATDTTADATADTTAAVPETASDDASTLR